VRYVTLALVSGVGQGEKFHRDLMMHLEGEIAREEEEQGEKYFERRL
jgi:hypothetical protein